MINANVKRMIFMGAGILVGLAMVAMQAGLWQPFKITPEIVRNLPANEYAAENEFNNRVVDQLGDITDATVLADTLTDLGFEVELSDSMAIFSKPNFPCIRQWMVRWHELDGRIDATRGAYRQTCVDMKDIIN